MRHSKTCKRLISAVLSVLLTLTVFPVTAFASSTVSNYNENYVSSTHTVFKHTEQTLAPGITNYTNYAYTTADGKQMVYYVTTADLTRDDVVAQVAYKDMQNDVYGMDKLSNMVACANAKYTDPTNPLYISDYYTVVSACNGDGYNMTTGEPDGVFIMGGNVKKDWNINSNSQFLAILKDGTAVIGKTQAEWDACKEIGIQEAIDIFGSGLVWDGQPVVAATGSYYSDRHSRTMVGVTADGKLVICVVDGRQEPFSCGASMAELAQIMIEAGCDRAFNLDGGGSTTFMAKNEGSNECTIQNRPSDGSERSISNGIIIASIAAPSNVFDHVNMNAEDEYITVGTSTNISAVGVSPAGTAADIPGNIVYEATNGTIANGIFTASAVGTATITAKVDGTVVGETTVNVVVPDSIAFASDTILIPYGKSANIEFVATKGLNEVKTNASNFEIVYGNAAAGSLNGLVFTAGTDESITGCSINATFVGSELTASANLAFGKGSEVLFDFEDGTTNGFATGYGSYNYYLPNGGTFVANAENGQVHSGNYALGVNLDYTNSWESGYQMNALVRVNPNGANADIPFVGANKIGCWIYIPDEFVGLWLRWVLFPISAVAEDGSYTLGGSITSNAMDRTAGGTGVVYTFQESGWHYLSCDFSSYKGAAWRDGYYFMQFYISDRDGADYNYYVKNYPNITGNFTVYIDDITVDYSSVIDDRDFPVFSSVTYAGNDMADAAVLADNATLSYSAMDFAANVADYAATNATGLNAASAKAFVDGNEVACEYKNGLISIKNTPVFTKGVHTVKFSICDNQGNYASIIRTFTVTSGNDAEVHVVPHDATLDRILFGSLYYVDVVADNAENIKTVTTTLNLDSVNTWELDHMVVAPGFDVEYTYEEADQIVKLTITNKGTTLTGEQALVSIPIRVWELDNVGSSRGTWGNPVTEGEWTYARFKNGNEYWWMAVEVRIQQGEVEFLDGTAETFSGEKLHCDTEAWAIQKFMVETQEGVAYKASWDGGHYHSAQPAADLTPTCTEDGYTGRTFCAVCNSVVDWGTTVPATGHTYTVVDGVLKCACGELFNGVYTDGKTYADGVAVEGWAEDSYFVGGEKLTGIQQVDGFYYDFGDNGVCEGKIAYTGLIDLDGKTYCSKLGVLTGGWNLIDEEWYYFDAETLEAVNGEYTTPEEITYSFTNGKLDDVVWVNVGKYKRCWYGPLYYKNTSKNVDYLIAEIDGETYLFNNSGVAETGIIFTHNSNESTYIVYDCGTDGVAHLVQGPKFVIRNGVKYFVNENGEAPYAKLIQFEGDYYFIRSNGSVMIGTFYVSEANSNGLVKAGTYEFDAEGKMILPEPKAGIIDGFYYENDEIVKNVGLVEWNDDFYYIRSNGSVMVGTIYISEAKANGLAKAGTYEFDAEGKMIVPELKNGIIDGFYYVDDEIVKSAGLIQWNGDYYYIRCNGSVMVGTLYVTAANANGLVKAGTYEFDAEGKMIVPELKNGIINGFYYVDDEIVKSAGLIEWNGDYYYIRCNGSVMVGTLYVSAANANGLVKAGTYKFDAEGKMIQ